MDQTPKEDLKPQPSDISEARQTLWSAGLATRKVVGTDYVENSLASASPFSNIMQQYATEVGWGYIWTRPGLDRKTRSLLNLAMLTVMGKSNELAAHVRGAVANGVTEVEMGEALLQAAGYGGFPAGMEGFRVVEGVLKEMDEKGGLPAGWRSK